MSLALLPLLVALPDRDEARDAAREELSRASYARARPPWYVRLMEYLLDKLSELLDGASANVPGGVPGLLIALVLVAALVAVVVVRLRPGGTAGHGQPVFAGGSERTAQEHRALADAAAARGAWAEAVRERLRAVVRELEARGVLDSRPGRTADEVAREAGLALPVLAAQLRRGAELFDEVWYGGRDADSSTYAQLVALDEAVRSSRLVPA